MLIQYIKLLNSRTNKKFADSLKRNSNRKGWEYQREAYKALKEIIENSHYYGFEKNDGLDKHNNVKGQDVYFSGFSVNSVDKEGKPVTKNYVVKIKLDVNKNDIDIYKGHKISEVEITAYENSKDSPHNNSTSSLRLSDLTQDVNYPKSDSFQ